RIILRCFGTPESRNCGANKKLLGQVLSRMDRREDEIILVAGRVRRVERQLGEEALARGIGCQSAWKEWQKQPIFFDFIELTRKIAKTISEHASESLWL
ncbi:hypothetical protein, partial [Methylosinus sp. Ce-a6]|uniref:hypothetical protein n=1 Tax=Methylosinus sp. Ce-a6 TaxID=2172005 RepID=UPI001AEDC424